MKKEQGNPNFPELEHSVLNFWKENKCFEKLRKQNEMTRINKNDNNSLMA